MMVSSLRFNLRVAGDYACFTMPMFKTERVSYEAMTTTAAKGVCESIYWKPEMRYLIDEIVIEKPIMMMNINRNEVSKKPGPDGLETDKFRNPRNSLVLTDVSYVIRGRVERVSGRHSSQVHFDIFTRRASKGQSFYQPFLGCREFPVSNFSLIRDEEINPIRETRDLGMMFRARRWNNPKPGEAAKVEALDFFNATMVNGVISIPESEY